MRSSFAKCNLEAELRQVKARAETCLAYTLAGHFDLLDEVWPQDLTPKPIVLRFTYLLDSWEEES